MNSPVCHGEVLAPSCTRNALTWMNTFSFHFLWAPFLQLVIHGGVSDGRPPRKGCAPASGRAEVHPPALHGLWVVQLLYLYTHWMLTDELREVLHFLQAAWTRPGFLLGLQCRSPSHQDQGCGWLYRRLAGRDNRWWTVLEEQLALGRFGRCQVAVLLVLPMCHWLSTEILLKCGKLFFCACCFLAQPRAKTKPWQTAMQPLI